MSVWKARKMGQVGQVWLRWDIAWFAASSFLLFWGKRGVGVRVWLEKKYFMFLFAPFPSQDITLSQWPLFRERLVVADFCSLVWHGENFLTLLNCSSAVKQVPMGSLRFRLYENHTYLGEQAWKRDERGGLARAEKCVHLVRRKAWRTWPVWRQICWPRGRCSTRPRGPSGSWTRNRCSGEHMPGREREEKKGITSPHDYVHRGEFALARIVPFSPEDLTTDPNHCPDLMSYCWPVGARELPGKTRRNKGWKNQKAHIPAADDSSPSSSKGMMSQLAGSLGLHL